MRDHENERVLRAAEIIRAGGVVVHPTDTVYGLACDSTNAAAVARVATIKHRPGDRSFIILLADAPSAARLAHHVARAPLELIERVGGAPVTFVFASSEEARKRIVGCGPTIALRVTAHALSHALCRHAGVPLVSTSANLHGRPFPTQADALDPEILAAVDLVVDGGPQSGSPSTILDCTAEPPVVLRSGAVDRDRIAAMLGCAVG